MTPPNSIDDMRYGDVYILDDTAESRRLFDDISDYGLAECELSVDHIAALWRGRSILFYEGDNSTLIKLRKDQA